MTKKLGSYSIYGDSGFQKLGGRVKEHDVGLPGIFRVEVFTKTKGRL